MTTRDEVLAMAEQADIIYVGLDGSAIANCDSGSDITEEILKFHAATYALAFDAGRKAEREECAKDKVDAERYRFLRKQHEFDDDQASNNNYGKNYPPRTMCVFQDDGADGLEPVKCDPGALDEAITRAADQVNTEPAVQVPSDVVAYSCVNEVAGLVPCKQWCGDMKKCVAKLEDK